MLEGGQCRLEDFVLFKPERVNLAEVFGPGRFDLVGKQGLGFVCRPLVKAGVALPEVSRHGAAGLDDRARQVRSVAEMCADGRALQIVHILHAESPACGSERHILGARARGRERGIAP